MPSHCLSSPQVQLPRQAAGEDRGASVDDMQRVEVQHMEAVRQGAWHVDTVVRSTHESVAYSHSNPLESRNVQVVHLHLLHTSTVPGSDSG